MQMRAAIPRPGKAHARELLVRISVTLKGLHAVLEIVGGIALWVVSPGLIVPLSAPQE